VPVSVKFHSQEQRRDSINSDFPDKPSPLLLSLTSPIITHGIFPWILVLVNYVLTASCRITL